MTPGPVETRQEVRPAGRTPTRPGARIALLDGFLVEWQGRELDLPPNVQRLVAHLCLANRPSRSQVAGRLWPERREQRARGSLRSALCRLERACPGIVRATHSVIFLAAEVSVDVRELSAWARRIIGPGAASTDGTPDVALAGELLPGWDDDWVIIEREHLRQLHMHALEAFSGMLLEAGRFGEALEAAYGAVRGEPLRESAHRAVIRVHLAEGNVVEAVRHFDAFAQQLDRELSAAPTAQLRTMISGVRPTRNRQPAQR
jgi:DNA-binding SARP family transcriptional activator